MAKLCIKVPFEWWHKRELDRSPFNEDWFPLDSLVQYVMTPYAWLEEIPARHEPESGATVYHYLYRVNGHDLPRTFGRSGVIQVILIHA